MPDPYPVMLEPPAAIDPDPSLAPADDPADPHAPIMEIMRTTRAMRHLDPKPVPADLLRAVIEAATWAPSGGNWQPATFVVITDRAKMRELAPLWARVIEDFRLLTQSAGIASRADDSGRKTAASIEYMREHFAETPALIVICEDPSAVGISHGALATVINMVRRGGIRRALRIALARPHFQRSEGASYYPGAQNLLLAARAHGLAACFTSWHLLAEEDFKRVMGIPRAVRTWAIIPIGYPLKRFGPVNRRPVDEVVRWGTW